jgi:hypothetical protein
VEKPGELGAYAFTPKSMMYKQPDGQEKASAYMYSELLLA